MSGTPPPAPRPRLSRESRLLLLTVAVCAAVLLVIARLRFPDAPVVDSATAPLERLAARASYDTLAADIHRVETLIAPRLVVLRLRAAPDVSVRNLGDILTHPEAGSAPRHVAAIRVAADVAVAVVPGDTPAERIDATSETGAVSVIGIDRLRGLARIRVPAARFDPVTPLPLASLPTPSYVVVVEGTQAGLTLRPVFLGRGDRFESSRWKRSLLPLGGIVIPPGALLFSLAGEFIGAVVVENGAPAVVGERDLFDAAARLRTTDLMPSDARISVQALTPDLANAAGASAGVLIADVDATGPAAGILEPGDVIAGVGGWQPTSPEALLERLADIPAGQSVDVAIVRNREPRTVRLTLAPRQPEPVRADALSLVSEPGLGTRLGNGAGVRVPGLARGDIIVKLGSIPHPTPAQVRRVLTTATAPTLAVVRRDGRQFVVALPAPRADGSPG